MTQLLGRSCLQVVAEAGVVIVALLVGACGSSSSSTPTAPTIRIETSNVDEAKVPSATVTVPAGSTSTTFRIDTSTVSTRTSVTFTATYASLARTASLFVTLPTPRASFTVSSPTRGTDACLLIEAGAQLDCRLDARQSDGVLARWMWVFAVVERTIATKTEPTFAEIDTGGCRLVNTATALTDAQGKYVSMTIQLEVQDRDGSTSPAVTKTVKLYTNDYCGI